MFAYVNISDIKNVLVQFRESEQLGIPLEQLRPDLFEVLLPHNNTQKPVAWSRWVQVIFLSKGGRNEVVAKDDLGIQVLQQIFMVGDKCLYKKMRNSDYQLEFFRIVFWNNSI